MPKRPDISSVLIIGSGPIVIGQACEFDYSGAQACKALREEGIRVILVNSNPATIMTDPEMADATYIEPLTVEMLDLILAKEKPDAVLPTLGGQTALNLAMAAEKAGILKKHGSQLIGASVDAIDKAEDRARFKEAMEKIGLESARSHHVGSLAEARKAMEDVGLPAVIRPSFTMGGAGGGIVYNATEFDQKVIKGLDLSPVGKVLIEESVIGWKEFELELMRDNADNVVIICSIENFDPMGIHTGDSITVAPAMTLTDREYQAMRDASLKIIREIGVDTGGSNIQFCVDPKTGRQLVIEMNPRVSRSSALASKATGFPIAKIAAKLAIGYRLDELDNDITKVTPACFEPTLDYVVVKMPRFAFEKFPDAPRTLGTQMKSVGEAMSIGRTFRESLGKAVRSLETGRFSVFDGEDKRSLEQLCREMAIPNPDRIYTVAQGFAQGLTIERARQLTHIDLWFLTQLHSVVQQEQKLKASNLDADAIREAKRLGVSDRRAGEILGMTEADFRKKRHAEGVFPVYKRVDTCSAEFMAHTPYMYSSYEQECESLPTNKRKVMILGGGPNRIGQGIEFDYCCVHAAQALKEEGIESIMVNCNPETVSTDYDTSDRLYFEPVTLEDVLEICRIEKPEGVIVQFGGQTPLRLAETLEANGIKLLGTTADAIDRAEDRERFGAVLKAAKANAPEWGIASSIDDAYKVAAKVGYPIMIRPSYVLGGRAMERLYDDQGLEDYLARNVGREGIDERAFPLLIDQFLPDAIELDVDVLSDSSGETYIAGIMEHIEEAGIHSGDSACVLPPYSLDDAIVSEIRDVATRLAKELKVVGLMNMQCAVYDGGVYIIEVNPRASRTVPFVSKTIGTPIARHAVKLMLGKKLSELNLPTTDPKHVAVKESVFPFRKFDEADVILGPEMRSTGEVMGIDRDFPLAFIKSQLAAGNPLPNGGCAFISVKNADKERAFVLAKRLQDLGFKLEATHGTARYLSEKGLTVTGVNKVMEGRPHCVDSITSGVYHLIINTTEGRQAILDSQSLRRSALTSGVAYFTTMRAAFAAAEAIAVQSQTTLQVSSIQSYQ